MNKSEKIKLMKKVQAQYKELGELQNDIYHQLMEDIGIGNDENPPYFIFDFLANESLSATETLKRISR